MASFVPVYEQGPGGPLHLAHWARPESLYWGSLEIEGNRWRLLEGAPAEDRPQVAEGGSPGWGSRRWNEILAQASPGLGRQVWCKPTRGQRR